MILILLSFFILPGHATPLDGEHARWSAVLKEYRAPSGNFRYAALKAATQKKDHPFLEYLQALEKVSLKDFETWPRPEQMAFLINAYNAYTVKLIVDKYPVSSIKKTVFLGSPWKRKILSLLDGKIRTLDAIEHEWLREKYKDARIHAAINCASFSCPKLGAEAFVAHRLDAQLDDIFKSWLADPARNQYDLQSKKIRLSSIFTWFASDFEHSYGDLKQMLIRFGPPHAKKLAEDPATQFEFLDYDWKLNDEP